MAIKGARSIAEYAIRKWLQTQAFEMNFFKLEMAGNEAELKDTNGDSITLVYDNVSKTVYVKE